MQTADDPVWSLTVQREIFGKTLVSAGCIGTHVSNSEIWIDGALPISCALRAPTRESAPAGSNLIRPYQSTRPS